MQPNEQPQHPIDYLDSISAAPQQSTTGSDKLFFGIIIGVILIVVAVVVFMILGGGASQKSELSRLSVRLGNLQTVSDTAQNNLISSKLRATNTDLALALASANRDIEEPLTNAEIDTEKISDAITSSEDTTELNDALEDARLNAVYDRTYAREMSYQLETLIVLIEQIESMTSDEVTSEFLSATRTNLAPLQEHFAIFTESNS